jgi:alanine racemase
MPPPFDAPKDSDLPLRPTVMEIDLDALIHNYKTLKARAGAAKLMAVLKANAYGHGLIECARSLERECGADYFGVALVEEGIKLRRAGISAPILIFGGLFNDQVGVYLDHDLELTASSVEKLKLIDAVAGAKGKRAKVHVKIDTGMGRIGIRPASAHKVFEAARECRNCDLVGVFTHFATSDERDLGFTRIQLERFNEALKFFPSNSLAMPLRHAANSGALLQFPDGMLEMVRCGLTLFGVSPSEHLQDVVRPSLKPVMRVTSKVVYFKVVLAGDSVSYGRTWTAHEDTRVITIPIGYGDGYPRALSSKGEVLVRGRRHRIVGRVCMDQVMVGIGDSEAFNGDEVVLVGTSGVERITIEELATHAGTIPYEILTGLNLRIPRRYLRNGDVVAVDHVA